MKTPRQLVLSLLSVCLIPSGLMAADKTKSAVDPDALSLLKRMSDTLASAKAFSYQSKSIVEVPAETGQFFTLFSTAEVMLQRPNKLSARLGGEAPRFDFFYDGATVTAFAPATKVYSQTKAPATIDAMLPDLEEETGIRFATTPLLVSDPYSALTQGLTSGVVVGAAVVNGVSCVHLAFRAPGVNWEVWVETQERSLPRRLAVTFTDRTNFPRTIIDFSDWNLRPWLRSGDFVFRQPAGATETPFLSVLKSSGR